MVKTSPTPSGSLRGSAIFVKGGRGGGQPNREDRERGFWTDAPGVSAGSATTSEAPYAGGPVPFSVRSNGAVSWAAASPVSPRTKPIPCVSDAGTIVGAPCQSSAVPNAGAPSAAPAYLLSTRLRTKYRAALKVWLWYFSVSPVSCISSIRTGPLHFGALFRLGESPVLTSAQLTVVSDPKRRRSFLFATSFRAASCAIIPSFHRCTNWPDRQASWSKIESSSWLPHPKRFT